MIEPSGQPAQPSGKIVPPTAHVPADIDINVLPTATQSSMTPDSTTPPTSAEISHTPSNVSSSIPENLTVGLPDTSQNLLLPNTITTKTGKLQHILIPVIILCIIVVGISSIAYAYVNKIGPFGTSEYTEANFSSSMLEKISTIKSASYTFSAALDVVPREPDATPFVFTAGNNDDLKKKYESDVKRVGEVRMIAGELQKDSTLPETLKERFSDSNNGAYGSINIIDPLSQKEYEYVLSEDKKDFNLTITFETDEIIKALKESQKSGFSSNPDSTAIEGRKVTFTKGSLLYGFINIELPKHFLTEMSDSMSMIPPDVRGKIAITASSELAPQSKTNWSFNVDAEGDMSDMTYKVNADISKIDTNYYFKINNFPGLALFEQATPLKGKWVVIPSTPAAETTPSIPKENTLTGSIQDSIKSGEESFKKNRDINIGLIKKMALVADREKLLVFKSVPKTETIDGRKMTRYELSIKKNNLQAFYTSLVAEIQKDPELMAKINANREFATDKQKETSPLQETTKKEVEEYLKSEEFTQIFDYIEKNNNFILWTDADGFPAIIQNMMRIVPSNTAEQLKDKQITLVFKLMISNINVPIVLTTPTDAVTWEAISKELNPTNKSNMEETNIIAGLSSIKTSALGIYATEGSYGKKGFGLGPCKPTEDTLFANANVVEMLSGLTNNNMSLATCASRGRQGKIGLWAISVPLPNEPGFSYCIDKNTSKKITGNLTGLACK